MKMLMLIVPSESRDRIESALTSEEVAGYTEIAGAYGRGMSGLRLGSRAFPGTSSLILTMLEENRVEPLLQALRTTCPECAGAMHAVVWGVERLM